MKLLDIPHLFTLSCLIILSSGCQNLRHFSDKEDRIQSLETYGNPVLRFNPHFPEIDGDSGETEVEIGFYLKLFSGRIFGFKNEDEIDLNSNEKFSVEIPKENVFTIDYTTEGIRSNYGGHCIPISSDGYFLTAAHCTDSPFLYVSFIGSENSKSKIITKKCRVVYASNKHLDFAIVHIDSQVDRFLKLTRSIPKAETVLYAGENTGFVAAGKVLHTQKHPTKTEHGVVTHHRIKSSIPGRAGFSGSPTINQNGELQGVTTRGNFGLFKKPRNPYSWATLPDPNFISKVIEADRKSRSTQSQL